MNDKKEKIVLDVAYQPQVRTGADTRRIMIDVIIALMPALIVAIIQFGWYPIAVCLVSMASAVFFEWAYRKLMKKTCTIGDCSAALTGLLMALTMPASSPLWLPIIGTFFAIVVVKQLYGGIGKNFLNPALAGRAFLIASYANHMTTWIVPNSLKGVVDGTTMATPMTYLYSGEAMPAYLNYKNIILGNMPDSAAYRRGVPAHPQGHHLAHPHRVHRHRRRADLHLRPRGLLPCRLGHVQRLQRQYAARRVLHGKRLCHQPCHHARPAALRLRLRRSDRAHPLLRQLSRRRILRYTYHEPLHMGDR